MKLNYGLLLLSLIASAAMATETPDYQVLSTEGKFELREYPALAIVRTASGDGDFMRLFRYISGQNATEEKIAMTAPVLVQRQGESEGMSFIMPGEMTTSGVPAPENKGLTIDTIPPGRFAVYRFSGWQTEKNEKEALAALLTWMQKSGLKPEGTPYFGYYDPPWIPGFFRRNEVMLRSPPPAP